MHLIHSFHLFALVYLLATYAYTPLSDASLASLPDPGNGFDIHTGDLLAPILKVRVPGTSAIEQVRHHFVEFFEKNLPNWNITFQNSTQPTALQRDIFFSNIIMSRDPPWTKSGDAGRLTLAAHYDSKLEPKGFIGAVDSAAPCAMLLHVARSIDEALDRKWEKMANDGEMYMGDEAGVQIFFLDGEEAFIEWSAHDSIYGAKALAAHLDTRNNPAMSMYKTGLNEITLFLLLDLLGAPNPNIPSYFPTTHWAYQSMASLESRLRNMDQFKSAAADDRKVWFSEADKLISQQWLGGYIEDDHVPFFDKGAEVLHIIPNGFPAVWHTIFDDGEHLDLPTVHDWAQLVTAFAAEWLDLEGFMPH